MTPEVLTLSEACAFLRVSAPTLKKLVAGGRVKGRHVGTQWRFLRSELEAYLKESDVSPAA